ARQLFWRLARRLGQAILRFAARALQRGLVVAQVHDIRDAPRDRSRDQAVNFVVSGLLFAAAVGFPDGALDRAGLLVGVQNRLAVEVARGPADGLDERALGAQETLLVGIQNADKGHLRQIEPLAQQVDANEDVEDAQAQVADDLSALDRV